MTFIYISTPMEIPPPILLHPPCFNDEVTTRFIIQFSSIIFKENNVRSKLPQNFELINVFFNYLSSLEIYLYSFVSLKSINYYFTFKH
jgi:hypothetical protein